MAGAIDQFYSLDAIWTCEPEQDIAGCISRSWSAQAYAPSWSLFGECRAGLDSTEREEKNFFWLDQARPREREQTMRQDHHDLSIPKSGEFSVNCP